MKFFSDFFRPPPGPAFRLDSPTSASPLRELFQPCQSRISLDCGCKGRNFHIPLQTFPRLFFEYFRIAPFSRGIRPQFSRPRFRSPPALPETAAAVPGIARRRSGDCSPPFRGTDAAVSTKGREQKPRLPLRFSRLK